MQIVRLGSILARIHHFSTFWDDTASFLHFKSSSSPRFHLEVLRQILLPKLHFASDNQAMATHQVDNTQAIELVRIISFLAKIELKVLLEQHLTQKLDPYRTTATNLEDNHCFDKHLTVQIPWDRMVDIEQDQPRDIALHHKVNFEFVMLLTTSLRYNICIL